MGEQAEAVLDYYREEFKLSSASAKDSDFENIVGLQMDIMNRICMKVFKDNEDVSDSQIKRCIHVIASRFDFSDLLWCGKEDDHEARKTWKDGLRKELRAQAATAVSRDAKRPRRFLTKPMTSSSAPNAILERRK